MPTLPKPVDWDAIICPENIGRTFEATRIQSTTAYTRARRRGLLVKTHKTGRNAYQVTIVGPCDSGSHVRASQQQVVLNAERRHADIPQRLREAQENLAYWKRQKALRENHQAKADAGARVLLWQAQVDHLTAQLPALPTAH